jgi:hypothetical protein
VSRRKTVHLIGFAPVTILGRGDLAPSRRHRPSGRYVTVALVVILIGGGGFAAYTGLKGGSGKDTATKLALCPKQSGATHGPTYPQSKVTVDNASLITGLASTVATELHHRGFTIGTVGNAAAVGKGIATIRYSSDREIEATKLAAQIKGAKLVQVAGTRSVELDINPKFSALTSKSAARSAFQAALTAKHLVTPSPMPSPSCRPRSVPSTRG